VSKVRNIPILPEPGHARSDTLYLSFTSPNETCLDWTGWKS